MPIKELDFNLRGLKGRKNNLKREGDEFVMDEKGKGDDRLRGVTECKYYAKPSNVTFDDIAGMVEVKRSSRRCHYSEIESYMKKWV